MRGYAADHHALLHELSCCFHAHSRWRSMSWHGVQSGSSIGAHAGMAAKVLRALAAVLVGGAAKAGSLKDRNLSHTDKLSRSQIHCRACRELARSTMIVRTDGEDSILIDFCSFASGRLAARTPYLGVCYALTPYLPVWVTPRH